MIKKKVYKIQHIPTGKFIKVKLTKLGIKVWEQKKVLEIFNPLYGNQLVRSHKGWSTPPEPSNEDFAKINCRVVCYSVDLNELN